MIATMTLIKILFLKIIQHGGHDVSWKRLIYSLGKIIIDI